MKTHEEIKIRYLLDLYFSTEEVERILDIITDFKTDEIDLEYLINEIKGGF